MRFFKEQTLNNVVVMGRKTYDSLGRKCLPGRFNVILSHQYGLVEGSPECVSATGIDEGLLIASKAPKRFKEIFVIGGASMYEQFAPFVDRYLITVVDKAVPDADAFFQQTILGDEANWEFRSLGKWTKDAVYNEADFEIFEVTARDSAPFKEKRDQIISEIERRAKGTTSVRERQRKSTISFEPASANLMI